MVVEYSGAALKQISTLHPAIAKRIRDKIALYAANPSALASQVKRLKGSRLLRLRVGDYRVIFTEDGRVLLVLRVGHRREIYD
jgi:mRNA interferase RelE/StbE